MQSMFTEHISARHVLSAGETEAQLLTWGGHSSDNLLPLSVMPLYRNGGNKTSPQLDHLLLILKQQNSLILLILLSSPPQ